MDGQDRRCSKPALIDFLEIWTSSPFKVEMVNDEQAGRHSYTQLCLSFVNLRFIRRV